MTDNSINGASERTLLASPIVLRKTNAGLEFLAYQHESAGKKIVKGDVVSNEEPYAAALRELSKGAGIVPSKRLRNLGKSDGIVQGERWYFFLCPTTPLADAWNVVGSGDDKQVSQFFWQSFDTFFTDEWEPHFIRAIRHIQQKLESIPPDQLNQYINIEDTEITQTIFRLLGDQGSEKPIDPTQVAREIAGKNEKEWRKKMKPVRDEAIRLAQSGRVEILRKGKSADPLNFKGVYKIGAVETSSSDTEPGDVS